MPSGLISTSSALNSRISTSAVSRGNGTVDSPWNELPQSTGLP